MGYTVAQVAKKHGWDDYLKLLERTGWLHTHIIQSPLSSERFEAGVVSAMQKKKMLGVTSRYVIILKLGMQKGGKGIRQR